MPRGYRAALEAILSLPGLPAAVRGERAFIGVLYGTSARKPYRPPVVTTKKKS